MALSGWILHCMTLIKNQTGEVVAEDTSPDGAFLETMLGILLLFNGRDLLLIGGPAKVWRWIDVFDVPRIVKASAFRRNLVNLVPCDDVSYWFP